MNLRLTPELEELVQNKVTSGRYASEIEVVEDALRLLEMRDKTISLRKDNIRELIEEGWQSAQDGELVDGDEFFDRMDAELEAMERNASK